VGILPSITDALQSVETHVIYRSAIPASSPNGIIDLGLYKLMTMQTRVFNSSLSICCQLVLPVSLLELQQLA